jgi:hypothetical protein
MTDIVGKLWEFFHTLRHDEQIVAIFEAIRQLMSPPDSLLSVFPRPSGLSSIAGQLRRIEERAG